jgi:hypothetical protein
MCDLLGNFFTFNQQSRSQEFLVSAFCVHHGLLQSYQKVLNHFHVVTGTLHHRKDGAGDSSAYVSDVCVLGHVADGVSEIQLHVALLAKHVLVDCSLMELWGLSCDGRPE